MTSKNTIKNPQVGDNLQLIAPNDITTAIAAYSAFTSFNKSSLIYSDLSDELSKI